MVYFILIFSGKVIICLCFYLVLNDDGYPCFYDYQPFSSLTACHLLEFRPSNNFGKVRIYPAGLAIAPFVLTLLFCGCDLAAPGGAVRRPISSGARKK